MGDLKKKKAKVDFIANTHNRKKIETLSKDERTIEMLKTYIEKFYEMQIEKQQNEEGEKVEDGTISDV